MVCLALALCLTFLSQDPPIPAPVTASLSAERAQQTVRELVALGPRMGGTPSGDKASRYLQQAFEAAGLVATLLPEPPTLVHWEEAWKLVAHTTPSGSPKEAPKRYELKRTWPYGFSPSAQGTFPVGLEPREGEVTLFEAFHNPPRNGIALAAALVDGYVTPVGDWPKLRPLRRSVRNPYPSFGISKEDGAYLRAALAAGDQVQLEVELKAFVEERQSASVQAILPARAGATRGFFVICAHGDSDAGGPGANDNASGVAIVLEMARTWKQAIDKGLVPAPAREVRFVVWSSEIRSTRHFLDAVEANHEPLLGVLNFDQAGYGANAQQMNMEPDDLPANGALLVALQAPLLAHPGEGGLPHHWATNKSLGGTDSYVFSGSKRFVHGNLPAVTLFTSAWDKPEEHARTQGQLGEAWHDRDKVLVDYDPFYHSAGDLPENTTDKEGENLVWCAAAGWLGVQTYLETLPPEYLPPLSEADLVPAAKTTSVPLGEDQNPKDQGGDQKDQ